MATRKKQVQLYAAEAPKRWTELREEELERENYTRKELSAWAKAGKLKPGTQVVWLMPKKKAQELARHYGSDDSEPVCFSPEQVVPLEETRDVEPGWVLATVVPTPEPEELVVLPPQELRAHSLEDALTRPTKVEALYLHYKPVLPEIARLKRLRMLESYQSGFTEFPEALLELGALEWLAISETPLQALPPSVAKLKALKCLYISDTQVKALPEALTELPLLTELRVDTANLGAKGESLKLVARLPALKRLEVYGKDPRPAWLKSFGDFTEVQEELSPYIVFVRPG